MTPLRMRGSVGIVAEYLFRDSERAFVRTIYSTRGVIVCAWNGRRFSARHWMELRAAHGVWENIPIVRP